MSMFIFPLEGTDTKEEKLIVALADTSQISNQLINMKARLYLHLIGQHGPHSKISESCAVQLALYVGLV